MAILVHRYDSPDRFVAGTVGQPGERTFFLQAREGNRITSVVVEKQQVSVLAEHLDKVLDEVLRRSGPAADVPPAAREAQRRRSAGRSDHRGVPGRHHDHRLGRRDQQDRHRAVLQRRRRGRARTWATTSSCPRRPRPPPWRAPTRSTPTRCSWSRSAPRTPATSWPAPRPWSSAGRPPCPFCLQPLDPAGHVCPRANGYRRPCSELTVPAGSASTDHVRPNPETC